MNDGELFTLELFVLITDVLLVIFIPTPDFGFTPILIGVYFSPRFIFAILSVICFLASLIGGGFGPRGFGVVVFEDFVVEIVLDFGVVACTLFFFDEDAKRTF